MKIFKVLSVLLSYPEAATQEALAEMAELIHREQRLPVSRRAPLVDLIADMAAEDLLELQARYVAQFDRGRALSLHLYEHIHGESRDRGQAMVDLMNHYRRHGFELDARELPDYLPLFLEFLAQLEEPAALALLADAMPVLSLLGARLAQRREPLAAVFEALEALAGEPESVAEIRQRAAAEGPDPTLVDMDRIWEEEAVSFMANPRQCGGGASTQPLRFVRRA